MNDDSYALQAEREMWDAIVTQDRQRASLEVMDEERRVWQDLAAGRRLTPPRELYREMAARYAGKCDRCKARVRRGDHILYSSAAPTGWKVICDRCDEGRL